MSGAKSKMISNQIKFGPHSINGAMRSTCTVGIQYVEGKKAGDPWDKEGDRFSSGLYLASQATLLYILCVCIHLYLSCYQVLLQAR